MSFEQKLRDSSVPLLSFKKTFVLPLTTPICQPSISLIGSTSKKREKAKKQSRERKLREMSKSAGLLVICAVMVVTHMITLSSPAVDGASTGDHHHNHRLSWIGSGCRGSMAECLAEGADLDLDDMEFLMDSETNRRVLATRRRYISYGALSRNNVPCSRRGASYYNCRSGGQANPYSRGCSRITRCRR